MDEPESWPRLRAFLVDSMIRSGHTREYAEEQVPLHEEDLLKPWDVPPGPERRRRMAIVGANISPIDFTDAEWADLQAQTEELQAVMADPGNWTPVPPEPVDVRKERERRLVEKLWNEEPAWRASGWVYAAYRAMHAPGSTARPDEAGSTS